MAVTANEQRLQILQERELRRLERKLERDLRSARHKVNKAAEKDLRKNQDINLQIALSNYRLAVSQALEKQARRIIPKFKTFVESTAKAYKPLMEKKVSSEKLILEYIALYGLANVDEIVKTAGKDANNTIGAAKNALAIGINKGLPERELNKIIRSKFSTLSTIGRARANTIARTESHNASTYATQRTAQTIQEEENIVFLKKWIPAQDERTRPSHSAMSSHPAIPMDAKFNVGGFEADRPGDPALPAKESINCRCQLIYETKG